MKTLKTILSLAALATAFAGMAAAPAATEIEAAVPGGRSVKVTAVSPRILRVDNYPAGEAAPAPKVTIAPANAASPVAAIERSSMSVSLSTTAGLMASINPQTGALTIAGANPGSIVVDNSSRSGSTISLSTTSEGSFYGAGERGHKLNLRGDTLVMYNRQNYGYTGDDPRTSQMNITMPLFLSTDGFAILFDDYAAAEMIAGNPIKYISESRTPVSYYYVAGDNLADLTEELTSITGRQPLAPLWALGYITSKYGYRTPAETVGTVDTLRREGYPLDGIVLDLFWFGKEEDMGILEWDETVWPKPAKMMADLKKKGVNLVTVSEPYVLRNGRAIKNYNELAPRGMFVRDSLGTGPQEVKIWVGEGGMFDVSNPETRAWLAQRYKDLTELGVGGWWGDLGEPEVHPESGTHYNGLTAREYHNKYGNDWSSIISELYRQEYPERRLLTLMRGGTTGLQRHSVFPWSTDVSRSWGGLEPQVRIMLNSGLSGLGYMSHDVGGFAVDPENREDAELYVRWLQLGLFSPVLRTHSTWKAEPYKYPELQDILKPIIKERYRWLPYNYTLAYENATKGWPAVRPLNFYGGKAHDDISDEFLWGRDVLVAPVMQQGRTERSIVFPEGSTWMDFSDPNKRYMGGDTIVYPAPLGVLPLFVRAGAFIPLADYDMKNTGDYRSDRFTVHYYPEFGSSSQFSLYDDDHLSASSLEKGNYRLINFSGTMDESNGATKVEIDVTGSYPGAPRYIDLTLVVHGTPSGTIVGGVSGAKGKMEVNRRQGTATYTIRLDSTKKATAELHLVPGPRLGRIH
ncbi:MAG: DUF5110 domain-containing protein [Muribaculaceae bacterium]|nr:DUF5110 domain-containing protein [Muribaculaceae bacterium]